MSDERFLRTRMLLGDGGAERLANATVAVVGLGAVGSYAVEGLARAGIGHLRLYDFDEVSPTNINRQLYALESTLGRPKVEVAVQRVRDINPACDVRGEKIFVHTDSMDQILSGDLDFVVDAIDALLPKVELLSACMERSLPVIASMGAALRTDPTAIRVGRIKSVTHCALAKRVRKMLRRRGQSLDALCVYSREDNSGHRKRAIAPLEESEQGVIERGRARRTMGSLPTITGIFGLTAANTVISALSGVDFAE